MNNGKVVLKNEEEGFERSRCEAQVFEQSPVPPVLTAIQLDNGITNLFIKYSPATMIGDNQSFAMSSAASTTSELPSGGVGSPPSASSAAGQMQELVDLSDAGIQNLQMQLSQLPQSSPTTTITVTTGGQQLSPSSPEHLNNLNQGICPNSSNKSTTGNNIFCESLIGEELLQKNGGFNGNSASNNTQLHLHQHQHVADNNTTTDQEVRWPDLADFAMIQQHDQRQHQEDLLPAASASSPHQELLSVTSSLVLQNNSNNTVLPPPLVSIQVETIRNINYPNPESIDAIEFSHSISSSHEASNSKISAALADTGAKISNTLINLEDQPHIPSASTSASSSSSSSPAHASTSSSPETLKLPSPKSLVTQTKSAPILSTTPPFIDSNNFNHNSPGTLASMDDACTDFASKCSSKVIAKVLESFNAILEDNAKSDIDEELDYQDRDSLRMVDTFADLLIGGENDDKDLLIVVDSEPENTGTDKDNRRRHRRKSKSVSNIPPLPLYEDTLPINQRACALAGTSRQSIDHDGSDEDDYVPDLGTEYPDHEDTEGYESDRPMVRASMRKLKPVQMLPPIPSGSGNISGCSNYTIPENPLSPSHSLNQSNYNSESPVPGPSSQILPSVSSQILVSSSAYNNSEPGTSTQSTSSDLRHLENFDPLPQCSYINEVNNPIYGEVPGTSGSSSSSGSSTSNGSRTETNSPTSSSDTVSESEISSTAPSGSVTGRPQATSTTSTTPPSITSTNQTTELPIGTAPTTVSSATTTAATPSTTRSTGRTTAILGPGLRVPQGKWPHRLSSVLALIGCTVGLNSICRFSLLSVEYGANFILQFIFLSLIFGIPLFTFHMSMGQYLSSGIIDMWKISPIFQGIGIGLVISQALIGIYTAVGVSWVFIYFRDSFITRYDQYRWGKCVRDCYPTDFLNATATNFSKSVPDYFNTVVLGRSNVDYPKSAALGGLKFTVAFNLAVVWMLVFVSLSKGLKSYGKVIHGFILVPVAGLLVLASKLGGLVPPDQTAALFGQTAWANFFFDSQTWVVAAREAFFTWGILGACVMQITSHNRFTHSLKSDATIVVLITTFVLLLSAFLGNACYSILFSYGYAYIPSSFESNRTYMFLVRRTAMNSQQTLPESSFLNQHVSFLMGVRIGKSNPAEMATTSGYQALRLATELFPATMAVLAERTELSYFWTILFYFTLIMFGLAQQIAIWYCVIRGVISLKTKVLRYWEITITFCVCFIGFSVGLPFCTELGIFVEYFMDYAIGSGWWIMVLYLLELIAVFIVRGAPYCGENIVTVLISGQGTLTCILAPVISFIWNVILPVAMLVLAIASFKSGNIRELYNWNPGHGYLFWPTLTKEVGSLIQLLPILTVPIVAIIQSCRYLSNGPPDLWERMQQLYRPTTRGRVGRNSSATSGNGTGGNDFSSRGRDEETSVDPPPKYTPPPSYSTATGAKIARFLRTSLRRSMRRFTGGPSTAAAAAANELPPPPNYATVIMEINAQRQQQHQQHQAASSGSTLVPIVLTSSSDMTDSGSEAKPKSRKVYQIPLSRTLGRTLGESKERGSLRRIASDITPRDIARILRASFRRADNEARLDDYTSHVTVDTYSPPGAAGGGSDQNNLNYRRESMPGTVVDSHRGVTTLNIEEDFLRVPSYETAMAMASSTDATAVATSSSNMTSNSGNGRRNDEFVAPVQVRVNVPSVFTITDNFNNANASSASAYSNFNIPFTTSVNNGQLGSGRRISNGNCHTRSSSSGASLMAGDSQYRGNSDSTDSQLTLISHSSSQNDLSNYYSHNELLNTNDSSRYYKLSNASQQGVTNPAFLFGEQGNQSEGHQRRPSLAQSDA